MSHGATAYMPLPNLPDAGPFLVDSAPYSNVGYTLLGAVIADVAKANGLAEGYEEYVYRHVALKDDNPLTAVAPVSMCLMPYWRAEGDIPGLRSRFDNFGNIRPLSLDWGPEMEQLWGWEGPSGGWTMTVGDLARLGLILAQSQRLGAATTAATRQTHASTTTNVGTPYGLGLYTGSLLGEPSTGHGGVIGSSSNGFFQSDLAVRNDASLGVAMVCNSGPRLRNPLADLTAVFGTVAQAAEQSQPEVGSVAALSPEARLLRDHGALLGKFAAAFRTEDGGADLIGLRRALGQLPEGTEIQRLFISGDLTEAARLLGVALDRVLPPEQRSPLEPLYPF